MSAQQATYAMIRHAIAHHPRSLQKRIGPSESARLVDGGIDALRGWLT